jgi:hypothetical protein
VVGVVPEHSAVSRRFLLVAPFLLAGCAPRTGDFGRPTDRDDARWGVSTTGSVTAEWRGELATRIHYTNDELELRDRAWRFLMPEQERGYFDRMLAGYRITRHLPSWPESDHTAYYRTLDASERASASSRYLRLAQDIEADLLLIEPYRRCSARVIKADRVRIAMLSRLEDLEDQESKDADARIAENTTVMQLTVHAWRDRTRAYRHALERLVITTPQHEAVPAERLLRQLEAQIGAIDPMLVDELKGYIKGQPSSLPKAGVVK